MASSAVRDFVNFWKEMNVSEGKAYVHPADKKHASFSIALEGFELSLLPIPINGNLATADVVILMLNPGFNFRDQAWGKSHPIENKLFIKSQWRNIHQDHAGNEYPFCDLNPLFRGHPGAAHWKDGEPKVPGFKRAKKLAAIISEIAKTRNIDISDAEREVANRVAIVQLFPYRSASFTYDRSLTYLPSTVAARTLAKGLVSETQKLIVVTRKAAAWDLGSPKTTPNLVIYPPALGRSAPLGLKHDGGRAILRRLLDPPVE